MTSTPRMTVPGPLTRPLLVVVSGPSGAGKTTLCDRLIAELPAMVYSISCTTRAPRPGEEDGVDYHFLSADAFNARLRAGDFLEHAVVHGHCYGTLHSAVQEPLARGSDVLMDIDVQGAAQLRAAAAADPALRGAYVDIFVGPPSEETLARRLRGRGQDDAEVIAQRLANAAAELARWREYRYLVVNADVDDAYGNMRAIVEAERLRIDPAAGADSGV